MTTIMNQVTRSLCNIKNDEINWNDHLMSTEHLQNCREVKDGIVAKFFNIIFKTYHNRKDLYNLEDEHVLDFWESYFEINIPKEKFDKVCNDSNSTSELETNLTADLLYFIHNCSFYIGDTFLGPLDKIIFCRICNEELLKSRLFEHITSKEHINTEKYFKRKCMTYCILCNMEVKKNEWNQHINSNWHLGHSTKNCVVCKSKYISI